jgi:hypothetical protein
MAMFFDDAVEAADVRKLDEAVMATQKAMQQPILDVLRRLLALEYSHLPALVYEGADWAPEGMGARND